MTLEKPPKYKEKGLLEANFYNINMKLSAHGHPKYVPPEGKTLNDLEISWTALERAEHERDLALKRELNRQEQLEQMHAKEKMTSIYEIIRLQKDIVINERYQIKDRIGEGNCGKVYLISDIQTQKFVNFILLNISFFL